MAKKITTEITIPDSIFNIKVGTLDKANPTTLYIECGTFIMPEVNLISYDESIDILEKDFRAILKEEVKDTNIFEKDYICIFDISSSRMKYGKKSFLSIQCHFKPKNVTRLNNMEDELKSFLYSLTRKFESYIEDNHFLCSKTKKAV